MTVRTILITGATGKLGRSFVAHFLSRGDCVVATARSEETIDALLSEHQTADSRLVGICVDLLSEGAAAGICEQLEERSLFPNCLVNNARNSQFLRTDDGGYVRREDFAGELLLDVIAPYELTMALLTQHGGRLRRVVNVGSQYGSVAANPHLYENPATDSPLHYSVAKAALAHLTRELAVRLAPQGVQVNCVAFGGVEGRVNDEFLKRYAALCPLGRMLTDEEVAGPVDMLLSDSCSGVTGHVMAVDGGWSIW